MSVQPLSTGSDLILGKIDSKTKTAEASGFGDLTKVDSDHSSRKEKSIIAVLIRK